MLKRAPANRVVRDPKMANGGGYVDDWPDKSDISFVHTCNPPFVINATIK